MKLKNRKLTLLLASSAALGTLAISPVLETQVKADITTQLQQAAKTGVKASTAATLATGATSPIQQAIADQLAAKGVDYSGLTGHQRQTAYIDVIVQLKAKPAAENGTLVKNYSSSAEIQAEAQKVIDAQAGVKAQVKAITGQATGKSYGYVVNGFSTKVQVEDLAALQQLAGVASVTIDRQFYSVESTSNDMANVQTVWANYKYKGEGTVVSVIDSGVDASHKDMRLSDPTKAKISREDADAFADSVGYGRFLSDKIPYGYNYADDSDTYIADDTVEEQHGMHVAGIIGANGTGSDPTTSVTGVAPEAQLLGMKVFSNSDAAATTGSDTVVSAIEDSAKLGADVLNMSLGSTSGTLTADDPEQAAVQNAIESGTAAVISAGNDGSTGSLNEGVNKNYQDNEDTETVGTPGVARNATTVASAENTEAIGYAVSIKDGDDAVTEPELTQTSVSATQADFDQKQFFVARDASGTPGIGTPDQYTADAAGKVAVVLRGDIDFTAKQANAKAAGATGLIIVNNTGDDLPLTSMVVDDSLPTISLAATTGQKLIDWLDNGHADDVLSVFLGIQKTTNANYGVDKLSTFTSYGPVEDLSFKPDITAPGGNIWSTQNNNGYTNMSGTSMASPFIAGSQALLKQAMTDPANAFYDYYQGLANADLIGLMKTIEMNTAVPILDQDRNDAIESPRRQGAGMVDVEAAIERLETNPTTVVADNGYPGIELKSIDGDTKTFKLTFNNPTDQALSYTLDPTEGTYAVYTDKVDQTAGGMYDEAIDGASVTTNGPIEVPAGGKTTVEFTLTLPAGFDADKFVEGFLSFTGSDATKLSIPYMGFHGDWDAQPIFDPLNGQAAQLIDYPDSTVLWAMNALTGEAQILGSSAAGVDPDAIAFSTSPAAAITTLQGQIYLLRNAQDVHYEIVNSDGEVVATLLKSAAETKTYYYANESTFEVLGLPKWDGTVFNQSTGEYEAAPDGQYTYRVSAVAAGADEASRQTLDLPVKVDSVAPELQNIALASEVENGQTKYYLTGETKDEFSGLDITNDCGTAVNGVVELHQTFEVVGTTADGYAQVRVPLTEAQAKTVAAGNNAIELYLSDNATNFVDVMNDVAKLPDQQTADGLVLDVGVPDTISMANEYIDISQDRLDYALSGRYPGEVFGTYVDENGETQDLIVENYLDEDDPTNNDAKYFIARMPIASATDYATTIKLYADAAHTQLLGSYDTKVAMFQPKIGTVTVNGGQTQTSEGTVKVAGQVSDDVTTATVTVNETTIELPLTADHQIDADVPVAFGDNDLTLTLTDADGNVKTFDYTVNSTYDADPLEDAVTFDNEVALGTNYLETDDPTYDAATGTVTLSGKVKHPTTTLQIAGQNVKINSDLTFSVELNVGTQGKHDFSVVYGNSLTGETVQERVSYILDAVAPTLTVDQPTDQPIHTTTGTFTISGQVTDNLDYVEVYINGNAVQMSSGNLNWNGNATADEPFSEVETLKEGENIFRIDVLDALGNHIQQTVTVYYDKPVAQSIQDAISAAKKAVADIGAKTDPTTGKTFYGDLDALLAAAKAGKLSDEEAQAQLAAIQKAAAQFRHDRDAAAFSAAVTAAKQQLGDKLNGTTRRPARRLVRRSMS
ncbi:S8 family serine peptidase [Lacticaseibacillus absianus]|uniref:S8 family serine peptidase n=1 Tax=Lacticaseibacillus absianus TaxID=2729623 RepID=UPI0015C7F72A|nr:S8 family serine peptidase [Lacticaseibacillus absianus]